MTIMFLPMSLFFIFRCEITRVKKIIIVSATAGILLIGFIGASVYDVNLSASTGGQEEFDSDEFWLGFSSFSYQLRFDGLVLLFILPLIVGLFIASRKGIVHADSMMVMLGVPTPWVLTHWRIPTPPPRSRASPWGRSCRSRTPAISSRSFRECHSPTWTTSSSRTSPPVRCRTT